MSIVQRSAGLIVLVVLLVALAPMLPVNAASKYKACSLLTAAELEAALGAKVVRTVEGDSVIDQGPYKGETKSTCDRLLGGSTTVLLGINREILTREQRAAVLTSLRQTMKNIGLVVEWADIAGAACYTSRPSASESSAPSLVVGCLMESKGFAIEVLVTTRAKVTPQQVKALADKVASRLP